MAFHNEIGAGRYNRFFQKLFNMKGGPPARSLGSDVMPVLPIFSGVEHRYLESWERFGAVVPVGAVAAQNGGVRLRSVQPGSTIIVVESIISLVSVAAQVDLNLSATALDLPSINVSGRLDGRGRSRSSAILSSGNATGTAAITAFAEAPAAVSLQFIQTVNQELHIVPGDALTVLCDVVNTGITVSLIWRERALEDSELK